MILKCYELTCLCLFNFVCCWLFVICLFSALPLHAIGNRHCYRVLLWLYQWPGRPVVTTSCYCLVYCAVYKSFLLWNTSRELSIGLTADILPRQRERERERESLLSLHCWHAGIGSADILYNRDLPAKTPSERKLGL